MSSTNTKKHVLKLLGYTSLTFLTAGIADSRMAVSIVGKVLNSIFGNIAASYYEKIEYKDLRNWFLNKDEKTLNHDLQKAFRDAIIAALEDLYQFYAQNLEVVCEQYEEKPPSEKQYHLRAIERRIGEWKSLVKAELLNQLDEQEDSEALLKEFADAPSNELLSLAEKLLGVEELEKHGKVFPQYFAANFGNRIQFHFGEQLKARPKAWVAFQRLWMQDVKRALTEQTSLQTELQEKTVVSILLQLEVWREQLDKLETTLEGKIGYEAFKLSELIETKFHKLQAFNDAFVKALDGRMEILAAQVKKENIETRRLVKHENQQTRTELGKKLDALSASVIANKYLTPTPPKPSKYFVGRTLDLQAIHEKLQTFSNVVLMNGMGGIGKTTLAQAYWDEYQVDYQYLAWITVSTDIQTAVLNSGLENSLKIQPYEGQKVKERFDWIWRKLANLKGKKLMVIDNANDAADLVSHHFNLPDWKVLLTSRSNVEKFEKYGIGVLPKSSAKSLFCSYYPSASEQKDLLEQLLEDIGYHTLTIELLAKNLRKLRNYSLQDLYDNLKEKGLLHPEKSRRVDTDYKQGKRKYEYIIAAMYDLTSLSEYAQWLLLQFAVLPSIYISYNDISDFLQIKEEAEERFDEMLADLAEKGWLDWNEADDSYKLHQVIQEVVRGKIKPDSENCRLLIENFLEKLDSEIFNNYLDKAYYLPYAETIIQNFNGNFKDELISLGNELIATYYIFGNFDKAIELGNRLINEQKTLTNSINLSITYSNLGLSINNIGRSKQSLAYYVKAIDILQKNKITDELIFAGIYYNMSQTYLHLGNYDKALSFQSKAYNIRKNKLDRNHPKLAFSNLEMGLIHYLKGEYEKALAFSYEATRILEDNELITVQLSHVYNIISLIYSGLNNSKKALDYQLKSKEIAEAFLDVNHPSIATLYANIGITYQDLKEYENALLYHNISLNIRKKILNENHRDLAQSFNNVANTFRFLDRCEEALEYHSKAISIAERIYDERNPDLGVYYGNLSSTYYRMGDYTSAKIYINNFVSIFQYNFPSGHPFLTKALQQQKEINKAIEEYK